MKQIWIIAKNTMHELFARRIVPVVTGAAIVLILISINTRNMLDRATQADDFEAVSGLQARLIESCLSTWTFFSQVLILVLAAQLLYREIQDRTAVSVLVKPITRTAFLLGKWLGLMSFVTAFQLIGLIFGLLVALYYGVHLSPLFFLSVAVTFAGTLVFGTFCFALGSRLSPFSATIITILLLILRSWTAESAKHASGIWGNLTRAYYYLCPAGIEEDLTKISLSATVFEPKYGLYTMVLAENLLFCVALMFITTWLFQARDIAE